MQSGFYVKSALNILKVLAVYGIQRMLGGHALKHAEAPWTRVSTALISLVSFILLTLGTVLFFVGIQAAVALQIGV